MSKSAGGNPVPMDPTDVFRAIANSRRRQVILSLARADRHVDTTDVAVEIAAIENQIDPSSVTGEQRTRVYIALTQNHLDLLHDIGAIRYNDRSKQIQPTDATEPLASHIRRITTSCYDSTESDP